MRAKAFAVAAAVLALWPLQVAAAAESEEKAEQPPAEKDGSKKDEAARQQIAPLQAREVIERLKTMRAQLLLEQEYNRLLEARLLRQELEIKLGTAKEKDKTKPDAKDKPADRIAPTPRNIAPPPQLESASEQLVVKAVTVAPFKEAIVTYKGRVYTVRPGDRLGNIEIRDVNDSGVVTSGGGGKSAVMLGQ